MKYAIILALALGLIVAGTSSSFADTTSSQAGSDPIFMNIPGVDGDVVAKGFENQIELNSFSFGVSNHVTLATGTGAGAGKAHFDDISITKMMDKTSPTLFGKVASGTVIPKITISFVKPSSTGSLQTYAQYTLENVIISGYNVSSGGDNPTESISLNFQKLTFQFNPINPDGSPGTSIQFGWDLALNSAL